LSSFRILILPILICTSTSFSQVKQSRHDTTAFLKEVIRVSDSLRATKNYQGAVHQLKKGLDLYRKESSKQRSTFDCSDTLVSYSTQLPPTLFDKNSAGKVTVYHVRDSSLFSGYVVHILPQHSMNRCVLYQNGTLAKMHYFQFFPARTKPKIPVPFQQIADVCEEYYPQGLYSWNESVLVPNEKQIKLSALRDTLSITRNYTQNDYERVQFFNATADTLEYYIQLKIGNEEHSRNFNVLFGEKDKLFYSQTIETQNSFVQLSLNSDGDTLNYDQSVDGKQNGLQVYRSSDFGDYDACFRLMWENGVVTDILNTDILFLNQR